MNQLIKKEKYFLRLILHTSSKQRIALFKQIETSQLRAIVQIVYNVLLGNRSMTEKDKKQLAKRKSVIRQFVSKGISLKKRKALLLNYHRYIVPFIEVVKSELL